MLGIYVVQPEKLYMFTEHHQLETLMYIYIIIYSMSVCPWWLYTKLKCLSSTKGFFQLISDVHQSSIYQTLYECTPGHWFTKTITTIQPLCKDSMTSFSRLEECSHFNTPYYRSLKAQGSGKILPVSSYSVKDSQSPPTLTFQELKVFQCGSVSYEGQTKQLLIPLCIHMYLTR